MKKMRIMVLALMVMAMAAGLLSGPAAAYAEGSTPEIVLGAGEIAKATSTARNYTVWFGRYVFEHDVEDNQSDKTFLPFLLTVRACRIKSCKFPSINRYSPK